MGYQEEIQLSDSSSFPVCFFTIRYDASSSANWREGEEFSTIGKTLPHWHRQQEILYIEQGDISLVINNVQTSAQKGDMIVMNGFDIHSLQGDGLVRVLQLDLVLRNELLPASDTTFNISDEKKVILSDSAIYTQVQNEFMAARNAFIEKKGGYQALVFGCLYKFIYYVNQIDPQYHMDSAAMRRHRFDYSKMEKLFAFVDENFEKNISIDEAAAIMNFSSHYFCKFFKQATGMTFFEYLNEYRCVKADSLLRMTNRSILEISLDTGFSSSQYFCRIYKRYRGYKPSQTRKMEEQTLVCRQDSSTSSTLGLLQSAADSRNK